MGKIMSGLRSKVGGWFFAIGKSLLDGKGRLHPQLTQSENNSGLNDDDIHLILELNREKLLIHGHIGRLPRTAGFQIDLQGELIMAMTFAQLRRAIIESAGHQVYMDPGKVTLVH